MLRLAACLGVFLAACQGPDEFYRGDLGTGLGGDAPTGAAGSVVSGAGGDGMSGAAGSVVSGAAGSVVSGAAGSVVSGAAGSVVTGTGGTSAGGSGGGATGTAGATGRGGATGTGGAAGAAGTTGAGGAAGRGGATGAGGAAGRGGAGGGAGSTARGGTGGTGRGGQAGSAGATGSGGATTCPAASRLDCTAAGALDMTPDGQVVDFSAAQWSATAAKWCDAHGLDGSVSSYAGTGSMATAAVDTTAQNLRLSVMVGAGQYAGGRVTFDACVDARDFNTVQFTAAMPSGSLTGCVWQLQLQTQNQRPTTATNPSGGTCTTNCEQYTAATLTSPTTAAVATYNVRFSSFSNVMAAGQLSGLQWQVNSGNSGSGSCTAELRIDNVRFVTQ